MHAGSTSAQLSVTSRGVHMGEVYEWYLPDRPGAK